MRRLIFVTIGFLMLLGLLLPRGQAGSAGGTAPVIPPAPLPAEEVTVTLEPITPADILADPASDSCAAAPELDFIYDTVLQVGGVTDVSNYNNEALDPSLAVCMEGKYANSRGYRSAWYVFTAPVGGTLVVRAASNADYKRNYDTTIAVFQDNSASANSCTDLAMLGCNDDAHGILSEVSTRINGGETYYIEVTDRFLATPGQVQLNLEATIIPDPDWKTTTTLLPNPRTRHAVVISGTHAFVLGGETVFGGNPTRTGETWRYDTVSGTWALMAQLNVGASGNAAGYANTDAVLMGDEIHYVSGSIGSLAEYFGQHWVYNIPANRWNYIKDLGGPELDWTTTPAGKPVGFSELVEYKSGTQIGFYLVGGLTGKYFDIPGTTVDPSEVNPTNMFYRFVNTGASQVWQPLPGMTRPRYAHTAAAINNLVCVVGGLTVGLNGGGTLENQLIFDGECYNTVLGSWQPNVGELNYPRYLAGSAVGPDGRWYVYGGIDQFGSYVPYIEVHDFATASWSVLPANYNIDNPALAWMRGGFVGDQLWLFGGEQQGSIPVGLVQAKSFPSLITLPGPGRTFLPLIRQGGAALGETPLSAQPLTLGVPALGSFEGVGDVYDVYSFDWPGGSSHFTATLTNIPPSNDYDLLLLDANKVTIAASQQIGSNPEQLSGPLLPGRYILLVARSAPPPSVAPSSQPYVIEVR